MTFKEIFERYRNNTASEEERKMVEEELEKNRLIAEYLDEEWDIPAPADETPVKDIQKVRKNMKKRSILIILTSIVICIAIFLTSWLVIIPILEKQYWNPSTNNTGLVYSTDLETMLAVYSELICHEINIADVSSTKTGFATYDLSIQYNKWHGGDSLFANASLEKGELKLPKGLLRTVPINVFTRASYPTYYLDENTMSLYREKLSALPDYITIIAAVSFKNDMSMEEIIELDNSLRDGQITWVGIRNSPTNVQQFPLCGFKLNQFGLVRDKLNNTYPDLDIKGGIKTTSNLENHFTSMLRFLDDQYTAGTCIELHGNSGSQSYFKEVLDYVENNGIYSYGCYVTGSPQTFLELLDNEAVEQIWSQDAWFNFN